MKWCLRLLEELEQDKKTRDIFKDSTFFSRPSSQLQVCGWHMDKSSSSLYCKEQRIESQDKVEICISSALKCLDECAGVSLVKYFLYG